MWDSAVLQMGSKESLGVYLRFSFVLFTLCQQLVIVELSQSLRILRKSFAPHPFTFGFPFSFLFPHFTCSHHSFMTYFQMR